MQEPFKLFPSGQALEALSLWSDCLKSFQQRLGKYYARSEARQAAFDYTQALLCPVERKNGWQMAEQVGPIDSNTCWEGRSGTSSQCLRR